MKYIVIFLLFLSPNILFANGATYGGAGDTVFPVENNEIELISERVEINALDLIDVTCQFVLHNTSDAITIQMGFPSNHVKSFKVHVDGKEVSTIYKEARPIQLSSRESINDAYLWTVPFAKNETHTVVVSYLYNWSEADSTEDSPDPGYLGFGYILETGKYWKNKIKNAEIIVDFAPYIYSDLTITPTGYTVLNDNKIAWHYSDFEPSDNIFVRDLNFKNIPRKIMVDGWTHMGFDGKYWKKGVLVKWAGECGTIDDSYLSVNMDDYIFDKYVVMLVGICIVDNNCMSNAKLEVPIARAIRNEIYARHGYIFKSKEWNDIFSKQSWYAPNVNFNVAMFNKYEKRNIKYLKEFEDLHLDVEDNYSKDKIVDLIKNYTEWYDVWEQ